MPVDERSLPTPKITSSPSSRLLPHTSHLSANVRLRPEILFAILIGVVLNLSSIETLPCLGSDHLHVLLKLGSFTDRRGLPADVDELIRAKMQPYAVQTYTLHPSIGLVREPSKAM
ncbi:hypothetical protein EVAR_97803_1 [Eumeta japonica]|uniref:Uncharacterized protein n=1 Tax=Eumeta variegata TaxID=151549 RepID=A0A4C1X9Q8_EUMVA|nr:hypothetical protein EVAR_97803_1 [Eumeta japonica]